LDAAREIQITNSSSPHSGNNYISVIGDLQSCIRWLHSDVHSDRTHCGIFQKD